MVDDKPEVDDRRDGADDMQLVEDDAQRSALLISDRNHHRHRILHSLHRQAEHRAERKQVRHSDLVELLHSYLQRLVIRRIDQITLQCTQSVLPQQQTLKSKQMQQLSCV